MTVRAIFGLAAILLAPPADAQWTTERADGEIFAHAVSSNRQLHMGVSCAAGGHVVMLSMLIDGIFHNGAVEADWDDGTSDRYAFADNNTALMATAVRSLGAGGGYSPAIAGLISKLRQRGAVRIRVTKWRDEPVTDRFGLPGSSRAIGSLPCAAARTAAPRQRTATQRRTAASMKRPGMTLARSVASAIQGELDTPMDRILAQMPDDVIPERSRSGADRMFIYRFADGSRLTLVARPAGDRSGLALYYVDIED